MQASIKSQKIRIVGVIALSFSSGCFDDQGSMPNFRGGRASIDTTATNVADANDKSSTRPPSSLEDLLREIEALKQKDRELSEKDVEIEALLNDFERRFSEVSVRQSLMEESLNQSIESAESTFANLIKSVTRNSNELGEHNQKLARALDEMRNVKSSLEQRVSMLEISEVTQSALIEALSDDIARIDLEMEKISSMLPGLATKADLNAQITLISYKIEQIFVTFEAKISNSILIQIQDPSSEISIILKNLIGQEAMDGIIYRLTQLENRVDSIEAQISGYGSLLSELRMDFSSLDAKLIGTQADLAALVSQTNSANQRIELLESSIGRLEGFIAQNKILEGIVATLQEGVESLYARIVSFESSAHDSIAYFQIEQLRLDLNNEINSLLVQQTNILHQLSMLASTVDGLNRTDSCSDLLILGSSTLKQADRCGNEVAGSQCFPEPHYRVSFDETFASPPIGIIAGMSSNTSGVDLGRSDRDSAFAGDITTEGMNVYCGSSPSNSGLFALASCSWMAIGKAAAPTCH